MSPRLDIDATWQYRRALLRAPRENDAETLLALRERSASFLAPWSPIAGPDAGVPAVLAASLTAQREEWLEDRAYRFVLVDARVGAVCGRVELSPVVRGAAQHATVGYWIDQAFAGQGLMSEAVECALQLAFGALELHRVQAPVIAHNHASIRVCEKLGFRAEGLALGYLRIAGQWQDHVIYALTSEEWTRGVIAS